MLIRSQDKSRLISLNNTRELRFWECAQGFDITDCVCPIGHYSTKAKNYESTGYDSGSILQIYVGKKR